jgi:hypothetical protein
MDVNVEEFCNGRKYVRMIGVNLLHGFNDFVQPLAGHFSQRLTTGAGGHAQQLHHGFQGQGISGPA